MKKFYPNIAIPFFRYDGQNGKIIQLIKAKINQRPMYLVGDSKEDSIFLAYRLLAYGVVRKVVNKNETIPKNYIQENEALWGIFIWMH